MLTPVILCGGSGTRLWPLSRTHYPKQFLRLVDERSLLQNTALRLARLPQLARPIAVTGDSHRFLLAEQLLEMGVTADILLEPVARNTAPAVAAAAAWALKRGGESPVLLVLPSDHVITDVQAFHRAVMTGLEHAQAGKLVTFGIVPVGPETGYGYIQKGTAVTGGFALRCFVEKPDAATALQYLAGGDYLWNSGMFLFRADTYLAALDRLNPAIAMAARNSVESAKTDLDFIRLDQTAFASSPADSIDYAVMEKITLSPEASSPSPQSSVLIPLSAGWNDIGAWDALAQSCATDEAGNLLRGDVLATETRNSVLLSGSRLVAAVGVEDLVVVETSDAVLVAHKSQTQKVKQIVSELKAAKREEADLHREVHRPWGSYEGLVRGERYQVKRIVVKPGRSLSLQLHHHRAEHWVVVRGTARVTRGEEVILLTENQSTFIPLGVKHRLENHGKIDLELVEIQSGAYLGEDDIVRFEDNYGRSANPHSSK
jgi:mannose-1-phosphate guanylyltransferase/mannose-6-phosphate isomerase